MSLPFLNNSKYLDPSYKMDLDIWIVLEGKQVCLITEEIQCYEGIHVDLCCLLVKFDGPMWVCGGGRDSCNNIMVCICSTVSR